MFRLGCCCRRPRRSGACRREGGTGVLDEFIELLGCVLGPGLDVRGDLGGGEAGGVGEVCFC